MTRVFRGRYQSSFPGQPPGAWLKVYAIFEGRQRELDFLIDTGSDVTMLSAKDSVNLLGHEAYQRLDDAFPDSRVSVTSVGMGDAVAVNLMLVFRVLGDLPIVFRLPVLITPPPVMQPAGSPTLLPSLLGRDILNHFSILLNPAADTVELTELEMAPA